jgi:hypothetical protein
MLLKIHILYVILLYVGEFLCVCVCVCLSGYAFPQFSTNLQIWREPSTGHDTWHGLNMLCVHATRARVRAKRARMCAFAYLLTDYVHICWTKLRLTISVKDYVLFIFTHRTHACKCACARARVIKRSLIYGRILFKFALNILHVTSSSMGYVLFMLRICECARD